MTLLIAHQPRNHGFTLVELAIVLIVVTLLTTGLLTSLGTQRDIAMNRQTEQSLSGIQELLLGFMVANGRLPCPDGDNNGTEDFTPNTVNDSPAAGQSTMSISCNFTEGGLPFIDIAAPRADAWDTRFHYRITPVFGSSVSVFSGLNGTGTRLTNTTGLTLNSTGNFSVFTRGDDTSTPGTVEAKFENSVSNNVAAMVISHGRNRAGGIAGDGTPLPAAASGTDEELNTLDSSVRKYVRFSSNAAAGCSDTTEGSPFCEFDDLAVWISPYLIFNRLIAAGKLP